MKFILFSFLAIFLSSCDKFVEQKYLSGTMKQDSLQKLAEPVEDEEDAKSETISHGSSIVIPDELKQKVSLTLNENLSVKSVLCEAAKTLGINFQIDPSVNAKVIFRANKKPFIEILDAVCDMANLRYTISNGLVNVTEDTPYSVSYDIQFLNMARDSENKISIATEVTSVNADLQDGKNSISPDSNVVVTAKSDFWGELDESLKIILASKKNETAKYSINRQSGVVMALANSKVHRDIREYISKIKESIMSQVLIEAKIIEVSLKNEYRRGINWGLLNGRFGVTSSFANNASNGLNNVGTHGTPMSFSYSKNNMSTIINALEEFGSTRTISNPRITAMNNQAAVLKVAQNHVYFKLNYDKTYTSTTTDRTNISVSSDIRTVPIGLVMFVQPSIDTTNNTITLFLRPTITKLSSTVNDPAVDIAMRAATNENAANATTYEQSKVPITEVREVASILKLNDGEIAVLGGFMEARSLKNNSGIPGYKDIPIAGELVSSNGLSDEIVELVILIKVKLANKPKLQKAADIRLQRFVPDPRPFL